MGNDKNMNPLSGDQAETDGVYRDENGHETELRAGDEFPMDPQLGKVEYELIAFSEDSNGEDFSDKEAAAQANVPVSAANEEEAWVRQSRQLKHRAHGGEQ